MIAEKILIIAMVALSVSDVRDRFIPDVITAPGIAAAIMFGSMPWINCLLGLIVTSGILLAVAALYKLMTKTEAIGGGDVKLAALVGSVLGWYGGSIALVFGLVLIAGFIIAKRRDLPFAPFLTIGVLIRMAM